MQRITIRLSDDLHAALQTIAKQNNLTLSELCRIALVGKLNKYCSSLKIIDAAAAADLKAAVLQLCNTTSELRTELQAIGNNYNQIARKLNAVAEFIPSATKRHYDLYYAAKNLIPKIEPIEDATADLIASSDLPLNLKKYTDATKEMQDAIADIYKEVI